MFSLPLIFANKTLFIKRIKITTNVCAIKKIVGGEPTGENLNISPKLFWSYVLSVVLGGKLPKNVK